MSESDLLKHLSGFSGGVIVYEPHSTLGPRWQKHVQLVYVSEGSMRIQVDEHIRTVGPGEITLLLPGHRETFRMDPDSRTRHGWATAEILDLSPTDLALLESLPAKMVLTRGMRELLRLLEPLFTVTDPDMHMQRDAFSLALLAQYVCAGRQSGLPSRPLPVPLQQACAFVEAHFTQALTVSDIARAGGVSAAHLIRLYQKHLHLTPMASVWIRRLEEGEQLLRNTGLTISEVAYACGFQTADHFSRRMKSRTGKSPREFRQQAWLG